jgi:acyl-CoA-binding protein
MSIQEQFAQAQADSKNLPERPDNMTLLKIYALFKQGSSGDANGERPGMTDFVARAKFDAWAELKGTSQEAAMQQYIDLIEDLKNAG